MSAMADKGGMSAFRCRCGNITADRQVERLTVEKRHTFARVFNRVHQIWSIAHESVSIKVPSCVTASAVVEHCWDLSCRCRTRFRMYIYRDDMAMIQQQNDVQGNHNRSSERSNGLDDFPSDIRAFLRHDITHAEPMLGMISSSASGDLAKLDSFDADPDMEIMFGATDPPEVGSCEKGFRVFENYEQD